MWRKLLRDDQLCHQQNLSSATDFIQYPSRSAEADVSDPVAFRLWLARSVLQREPGRDNRPSQPGGVGPPGTACGIDKERLLFEALSYGYSSSEFSSGLLLADWALDSSWMKSSLPSESPGRCADDVEGCSGCWDGFLLSDCAEGELSPVVCMTVAHQEHGTVELVEQVLEGERLTAPCVAATVESCLFSDSFGLFMLNEETNSPKLVCETEPDVEWATWQQEDSWCEDTADSVADDCPHLSPSPSWLFAPDPSGRPPRHPWSPCTGRGAGMKIWDQFSGEDSSIFVQSFDNNSYDNQDDDDDDGIPDLLSSTSWLQSSLNT